jgi:hypothetical protein
MQSRRRKLHLHTQLRNTHVSILPRPYSFPYTHYHGPEEISKRRNHVLTRNFCFLVLLDITGEEEEDVELEQKGVKLYVKRGDRPFGDGMLGHVKLLSNRTTGEERIRALIAYSP